MIIVMDYFYYLLGIVLALVAYMNLRDASNPKRYSTALFWGLYAVLYLAGDWKPTVEGIDVERTRNVIAGGMMVLMALIAGFGGVGHGVPSVLAEGERRTSAARLGHSLFIPALLIPTVTMIGSILLKDVQIDGRFLLDQKHLTLASLGCGALIAVTAACLLTRASPVQAVRESRRLIDAMGWAVVLPHMLAVLGLLFSEAGVGKAVAHIATSYIAMDSAFVAVAVYCLGMALFTIVMGNGFAAFPVMAGGVGIPILIGQFGANPAVMAAIGMFSAYCGTLMTPMAANFNLVPAALLELDDKNAVIKAQVPTALPLLIVNIFLLYFLMNQ